jgi:class 3 adenylate cyclase/tetratricopeptide (TPR) repeat protein
MKCPKCQNENPEGKKFCSECGGKLTLACPQCNAEILPGDRFCGECGHSLSLHKEAVPKELSFGENLKKIQRYLPTGLTEKILSQRDNIEGERKQVTVMFCDMEAFTQLSERLGPEQAYEIMNQVYEILIHKVHDQGGTVNEMTGDGIMALFGAPIALEDSPQRAIRSGMAIHREMTRFNERVRQEKGDLPPVKMRVGINTGPVVVGTIGNDLRMEFKAVGDTVNLASRMESLAEPGSTYVSEETFNLTEGLFRFEALGEKEIKGKDKPHNVYRVIAPSTRRTRFDVNAERGLTPFVGRERELELLLDSFERTKAGRGQAFSIMSEAGGGKSRLLYEFRKAVTNEDVTFLEGKCLSYGRGVAYHPHIDILKANFDIQEGEEDSRIKEKVIRGLRTLAVEEAYTLPYLLELLSVKDTGMDKIQMSPEARKDRIIEALKRVVIKGSEIRPLIIAFEDLHWVDKCSENVLKYLLESIPGARVLMIFTYRPEFVCTWGAKSFHSQTTLNRLSNRESLVMMTNLLGTENIDSDLEELILDKTEGIPFFIEELIKSLRDLGIIQRTKNRCHLKKSTRDLAIPSTIQDVIMARVDSLPDGAKRVLQAGAVIEREFTYELIKTTIGLSEKELFSHLSILKDSELLYERGIYPQSTFIFKHALTRDVVYDSILQRRKKKLHEKIAYAIEDLYRANINEQFGVLAQHFIQSGNYEKGAEYSKLAAKNAQEKSAFNGAILYSKKTISCLENLPKTDLVHRKIIDARAALSDYYLNLGDYVKAKEAVTPIVNLAIEMKYHKRLPRIYTALGNYNMWSEEDYNKGVELLVEAARTSEKIGDFISLWFASFNLIPQLSWNCEFEKGLKYYKKCQDLSKLANNPLGISTSASAVCASNYCYQGKLNLCYETSKHALDIAEEIDDIFAKGIANISHGVSLYFKGLPEGAEEYVLKGEGICEKINQIGWASWANTILGALYYDAGKYAIARDCHVKAISINEAAKWSPSWTSFNKLCLARIHIVSNSQPVNLDQLVEYYSLSKYKICRSWMARLIVEILLNTAGHALSDSENWVRKAIEANKMNGTKWLLAHDYTIYAELLRRQGNQLEARKKMEKAVATFTDCGAEGWVKKVEEKRSATL